MSSFDRFKLLAQTLIQSFTLFLLGRRLNKRTLSKALEMSTIDGLSSLEHVHFTSLLYSKPKIFAALRVQYFHFIARTPSIKEELLSILAFLASFRVEFIEIKSGMLY